jgi:hypothetical protein
MSLYSLLNKGVPFLQDFLQVEGRLQEETVGVTGIIYATKDRGDNKKQYVTTPQKASSRSMSRRRHQPL